MGIKFWSRDDIKSLLFRSTEKINEYSGCILIGPKVRNLMNKNAIKALQLFQ